MSHRAVVLLCLLAFANASHLKAQHIGPAGKRLSFGIGGKILIYDLSSIHGEIIARQTRFIQIDPGKSETLLTAGADAFLLGPARTVFGTSLTHLRRRGMTVDQLPEEARADGEVKHMFFPPNKPTELQVREIDERRWLVTTKFEGPAKPIVENRTFWLISGDYLITININFTSLAPVDANWRRKRLDILDRIVEKFRIRPDGAKR